MTSTKDVKELDRFLLLVCYGLFFILVLIMSTTVEQSPFLVIVGLLPTLIYLVAMLSHFIHKKDNVFWLGVLPFILPIIFFIVWRLNMIPTLSGMEGTTLTVLNMFFSYFFAFMMLFSLPGEQLRIKRILAQIRRTTTAHNKAAKRLEKASVTKQNVVRTIRTIEDKCKAINFVIGRVYSDKKGGSKKIREQLGISRDLYNAFTDLVKNVEKNRFEIMHIVEQMQKKLNQLDKKEFELFRIPKSTHIPVSRDFFGHDKVIDVLAKNDKDPVSDYVKQAKETCEQVVAYLKQDPSKKKPVF